MVLHLMKLSNLLQKHQEITDPRALSKCLGDGYLNQRNRIFRAIREETISLGYTYSDRQNDEYLAFPMGQLENILTTKTIPFTNNVDALVALNQKTNSQLEWDHIVDNLKPNYVFHESCHAIARSKSPTNLDFQSRLTTILLEESFANACEYFAIVDAQDHLHKAFLEVNSYFVAFEDRSNLKKIMDTTSPHEIFKFMLLAYMHSNFLNERFDDQSFKSILDFVDFKKKPDEKSLKTLAKIVFALNPRFRYTTTEMYLRLNGISEAVENAVNFDYLKVISNSHSIHQFLNQLSTLAGDAYEH